MEVSAVGAAVAAAAAGRQAADFEREAAAERSRAREAKDREKKDVLFEMFGGKVALRPAKTKRGERPYLVARLGLDHTILLEAAAGAAGCVKSGSGGMGWISNTPDFVDVELR